MKAMKQTVKAVACAIAVGLAFQAPATDWTFDKSTKRISRDGWTLNTSLSGSDLTVTGIVTMPTGATAIDFSGDVADVDGKVYRITTINSWGSSAAKGALTSVTLPATLISLGDSAFNGFSKLVRIEPFLPDSVTSVGCAAFGNSPVAGKLRLGYGEKLTLGTDKSYHEGKQLMGTKVADIDFGPALTTLPISFANGLSTLTNVTFAANGLQAVEHHAFYNCTALKRIEPFLPDTVTSVGYFAFYNCPIAGKFRVGYGETLALGVIRPIAKASS